MTTINKDDAIKAIEPIVHICRAAIAEGTKDQAYAWGIALDAINDAIDAISALPDAGPNIEYGRKHTDGSRAGGQPPICSDFDDDCDDIEDKVICWLYDPAKGRCPYLGKQ